MLYSLPVQKMTTQIVKEFDMIKKNIHSTMLYVLNFFLTVFLASLQIKCTVFFSLLVSRIKTIFCIAKIYLFEITFLQLQKWPFNFRWLLEIRFLVLWSIKIHLDMVWLKNPIDCFFYTFRLTSWAKFVSQIKEMDQKWRNVL